MKKRIETIGRRMLSAVLAAALILLLQGCASVPQSNSPDETAPFTEEDSSEENSSEENSAAEEGQAQEPDPEEEIVFQETAQRLPSLPAGYLADSVDEIPDEEGEEINRSVADMLEIYRGDPLNPAVKKRDWKSYASQSAKGKLTEAEAAFYDRLDRLCRRYISDDSLNGVWREQFGCYVTEAAVYSDLGLTMEQACDVRWWFKYNNPQYYFLESGCLASSRSLFLRIYDFASDAKERAKITNEMFDKLDGWIASVNASATTTWEKELAVNDLLCKHIFYDDALLEDEDNLMGQTLYSAVILEGTVCAGYAQAFAAMMNMMGVDTIVALSTGHAWNVSLFDDGNYYAIDVTWNDNENDDNNPYHTYFNVGEQGFQTDSYTSEMHTYSDETRAWTPEIPQTNCSPTYQSTEVAAGPGAPQNFTVYKTETTALSCSWTAAEGAEQYECALFADAGYSQIAVSGFISGTAVLWENLTPGATYYLGVRSVKTVNGSKTYSDWTCISAATAAK